MAGSNRALDSSIRLRPELLDFLRQDHMTDSPLAETLARREQLAARLEVVPARRRCSRRNGDDLPHPAGKRPRLAPEGARTRGGPLPAAGGDLTELDRQYAEVEAAGIRIEIQVREWSPIAAGDLAALGDFRLYIRKRE